MWLWATCFSFCSALAWSRGLDGRPAEVSSNLYHPVNEICIFWGSFCWKREKNLKLACATVKLTKVCLSPGISYLHSLGLIASSKNSFRPFSVTNLHFSNVISAFCRCWADLGLCSRKGSAVRTVFWFIAATQVNEESFVGRKEVSLRPGKLELIHASLPHWPQHTAYSG